MKEVSIVLRPSTIAIDDPPTNFDVKATFSPYRLVLIKEADQTIDFKISLTVTINWPSASDEIDGLTFSLVGSIFERIEAESPIAKPGQTIWSAIAYVSRGAADDHYSYSVKIHNGTQPLHKIDPILVISG